MRGFGRLVWVGLGAAAGCVLPDPDPGDGGQIGEEGGAGCGEVGRTAVAADEVTPLGFAAADVLAYAVGSFADTLTYADGTSSPLAVTVTETGDLALVDMEVVDTGGGTGQEPAIEPWCSDLVAVGVSVTFATDDGTFAEAWDGEWLASTAELAALTRDLDAAAGTFDAWDFVPAGSDYDEVRAWLDLEASAAGLAGVVHGQGSGSEGDPNDPDGVSYAEMFDVASFGAPTE